MHSADVEAPETVSVWGVRYVIPARRRGGDTVLAVNVGGAVIPCGLAARVLLHSTSWLAAFVHLIARPVEGVGIVVPTFAPPIAAAAVALLSGAAHPAAVAYVAGTLGTLVGADLTNLHRIRETGAGVASIGGAGTFDAVFLCGIIAVALAATV